MFRINLELNDKHSNISIKNEHTIFNKYTLPTNRKINTFSRPSLYDCARPVFALLISFAFLIGNSVFSQVSPVQEDTTKTVIEILNANKLKAFQADSVDLKKLIGEVQLQQDDILFDCDSAYLFENTNSIDAFGNVQIQQGDSITITADFLKYDGSNKIAKLFNNVVLNDQKNEITSDTLYYFIDEKKAVLNSNVFITDQKINITSDSLEYYSDLEKANLYKNVKLVDGEMTLEADEMDYDFKADIGTYEGNGFLTNKETTLQSDIGWYNSNSKDVLFEENVLVIGPKYELTTDRLEYNIQTEIAVFEGNSLVKNEGNTIECSAGSYDQKRDVISLSGESTLVNGPQILMGDSLFFEQESGKGYAFGNVYWEDTSQNLSVDCAYMEYDEESSYLLATGDLVYRQAIDGDTLYLTADTLNSFRPEPDSTIVLLDSLGNVIEPEMEDGINDTASVFYAYNNVRFYKSDFQGVCDSLVYDLRDSSFQFYSKPILWFDNNQLNADTILLETENNDPSYFKLLSNSFIGSEQQEAIYNQLKGINIEGTFENGDLVTINISGSAESIYYATNDTDEYYGVNQSKATSMAISLEDKEVTSIKFYKDPAATFNPIKTKDPYSYSLDSFSWREDQRPKDKKEFEDKGITIKTSAAKKIE